MKVLNTSSRRSSTRQFHQRLRRMKHHVRKMIVEQLEDRRLLALIESFDSTSAPSLPNGWSTDVPNPWVVVSGSSNSSPNHAFVPNLSAVSDSSLTSPAFTLSPATPLLTFRNWYITESDWDGGVLEISINSGAFVDILAGGGSFLEGGYVGMLNSSDNPISGRNSWNGDSEGYINTIVQLPASSFNQSIALRWRLGSDSTVADIGWRIDTIAVTALPAEDFGDAPVSYPVTLLQNGARHLVGALALGSTVNAENDGIPSDEANSDDFDDGVVISGDLSPSSSKQVQIIASQSGGLLNSWIDWNRDGDWGDAGEQVFSNISLTQGSNSLTLNVPSSVTFGSVAARFRLSTVGNLSPVGPAPDGEVEDYVFQIVSGNWVALGPFGATDGQVEGIAGRPVTGAIHSIISHPTNPDIAYIGAVNGGVWKTVNATALQPSWVPLTDTMPSQSIGALAFDQADSTSNTVYAGIGRFSSYSRIGNRRAGLLRTQDGGQTWQVVNGGGVLTGKNISGIVANGNNIVVSVNTADSFSFPNIGIFRSTNGGVSFTQMSVGNGTSTGLPGGVSYDLVADPLNPNILYTSTVFSDDVGGVNGVYRSLNGGATWAKVSNPAMDALIVDNTSNLELAAGRHNEVYAAIINAGAFAGLFRSPDNGTSWVRMDNPQTNENGTNVGLNPSGGKGPTSGAPEEISGGQGSIHFAIVADPANPNLVYVGGDRQPRANGDTGGFPNSIGANDFTGRLFRGDASRPLGSQFVHLTHTANAGGLIGGGTANRSAPHADSREMTFDSLGNLLQVDDGGVYRRTSPQNNTGDWFSMIGNLQVTEAHDVAWDSLSNVAITGNQDTGTTYQTSAGALQWRSLSTADGGDVAVDNLVLSGSNQSVRYTSFQNLGSFRRTVWNASGGLVSTSFPSLTPLGGAPALTGGFRTPVETNSVAGNRLLIQGTNGLYESLNGGNSITLIGGSAGSSSLSANTIVYGGVQNGISNPDVVWAASGSNLFSRSSGTGNVSAVTSPTTSTIRDIALNGNNWANAFVIDNNQVFETINAGTSWSDITANLLAFASEIFSVSYVSGSIGGAVIAGTNAGIYAMSSISVGSWFPLGGNIPNVPIFDIQYNSTDNILLVGTLGRGTWSLSDANLIFQQARPTDIALSNLDLNENLPAVSAVGVFSTTDPNAGDTFTYTFVIGAGSTDNASFTLDGSTLRTAATVDFETKSSYSIRIRTTDQSGLFYDEAFTISVLDLPELVGSVVVGDGTIQRSMVNQIQVTFDSAINIASGAFSVVKQGTGGGPVTTAWTTSTNGSGQTVVTLTFTGSLTRGTFNALSDGNYILSIDGTKITRAGRGLDSNKDGVGGDSYSFGNNQAVDNFFALYGDTNGDRLVNVIDRAAFAFVFLQAARYRADLDSNGDGVINVLDRAAFAANFLRQ